MIREFKIQEVVDEIGAKWVLTENGLLGEFPTAELAWYKANALASELEKQGQHCVIRAYNRHDQVCIPPLHVHPSLRAYPEHRPDDGQRCVVVYTPEKFIGLATYEVDEFIARDERAADLHKYKVFAWRPAAENDEERYAFR